MMFDEREWECISVIYHHNATLIEHYEHRATGIQGALKTIDWANVPLHERAHRRFAALQEARLHAAASNKLRGVLPMWFAFESDHAVHIMTQFVERGTLHHAIYGPSHNGVRPHVANVAASLVPTVAALHRMSIYHNDIKPENVMIGSDDTFLLGDFGIASKSPFPHHRRGTVHYMAPEVLQGVRKNQSKKLDVWALGITLYEVACGSKPFTLEQLQSAKTRALHLAWPRTVDAGVRKLITSMLVIEPDRRQSLTLARPRVAAIEKHLKQCHVMVACHPKSISPAAPAVTPAMSRTRCWSLPCITC